MCFILVRPPSPPNVAPKIPFTDSRCALPDTGARQFEHIILTCAANGSFSHIHQTDPYSKHSIYSRPWRSVPPLTCVATCGSPRLRVGIPHATASMCETGALFHFCVAYGRWSAEAYVYGSTRSFSFALAFIVAPIDEMDRLRDTRVGFWATVT